LRGTLVPKQSKIIILSVLFIVCAIVGYTAGNIIRYNNKPATAAPLMSTSTPSLTLNLSASSIEVAVSPNSALKTQGFTSTVSTEATSGYKLQLNMSDANTCLRHSDNDFTTTCASLPANQKLNAGDPSTTVNTWGWSSDNGLNFITPQSSTGVAVFRNYTSGPYSDHETNITFGVKVDASIIAGFYESNPIIVTALANPLPTPTITTISPSSGSSGTAISITGTNLDTAYQVFVDLNANGIQDPGEECTNASINSTTNITCNVPTYASLGARHVYINTWGGIAWRDSGFTYVSPPPIVTSISPDSGHFRGGETFTITGSGFTGATNVNLGGSNCRSYNVVDNNTIVCVSSGIGTTFQSGVNSTMTLATNTVSVNVITPGGTNTPNTLFIYRYGNSSLASAGSFMDILGTDIELGSKIFVNGVECINRKITSNTTAACNAPITSVGAQTVTIQPPPPSSGNIQNWTGCSTLGGASPPAYTTTNWAPFTTVLTDTRNGQNYRVRRLPDNRCWMIDNLKLATPGTPLTLTSTDSDVSTNFTIPANPVQGGADRATNGTCVGNSLGITGTGNYLTCDGTTSDITGTPANTNFNFIAYSDPAQTSTDNRVNSTCTNQIGISPDSLTNCGYLYNWYTATAGTGTRAISGGSVSSSLCPLGWKLPTIDQFRILNNAMLTGNTTPATTDSIASRPNWRYAGPFEGTPSGNYSQSLSTGSTTGSYWLPQAASNTTSYLFSIGVSSAGFSSSTVKYYGLAIRCIL